MTNIDEKKLKDVSGAGIREVLNSDDIMKYIQVLTERPGIVDRLGANLLSDEDEEAIAHRFYSVYKFITIAGFAHGKTIEELTAIAAANSNK